MYLGRAVANTYITIDWVLNYSVLQPYWNLAFQQYKDGQDAWKAMQEEEGDDEADETLEDAEDGAENGDDPSEIPADEIN